MRKFEFRLQRVLEFRELAETWAKEAYLEAHSRRIAVEQAIADLENKRHSLLEGHPRDVHEFRTYESYLELLDDEQRHHETVRELLVSEEDKAKEEWLSKRRDHELMKKLHDNELREWQLEMDREEQKMLDEWSNQRREAA